MKLPFLKTFFYLCLSSFLSLHSFAQLTNNDSAVNYAVSLYHAALSPETSLYNGRQYFDYTFTLKGQYPYFESPSPINGSIVYDHILYENIPIQYDMVTNQVVVITTPNNFQVVLDNDRINSFYLDGHKFVRVNTTVKALPGRGFLEILHDGKISLFKKQTKSIQESVTVSEGLKRFIDSSISYYVQKGNEFFEVSGKGDLLKVFKDRKKDISQFIKGSNINFRTDKENALEETVAYYDTLTK